MACTWRLVLKFQRDVTIGGNADNDADDAVDDGDDKKRRFQRQIELIFL